MSNEKSIENAKSDNGIELYNKFTKSEIIELSSRIKPVMPGSEINHKVLAEFLRVEKGNSKNHTPEEVITPEDYTKLYYIYPGDPFTYPFSWDPKPIAVAEDLVIIKRIDTYHPCKCEGIVFKPTQNEVISQIPEELLNNGSVVAYTISFDWWWSADRHKAETVLYGKTEIIKKKYDNAVRMLSEAAKKFDSFGFRVTFDPNQLTMGFTGLTKRQKKVLWGFVEEININGGQKFSVVPMNNMYLLYFMRGNQGYAYLSNPIRQRETVEQAGKPNFNITDDAYGLVDGLESSAEKLLELIRN